MTVEKVMKLSEVKFGDLIKFSKNSKVDWFIGYKDRDEIEMWSSNDTTRTILDSSKTWNKKIIIVGQNLTPAFSQADFNDEIQAEADSGLPDREVIETMTNSKVDKIAELQKEAMRLLENLITNDNIGQFEAEVYKGDIVIGLHIDTAEVVLSGFIQVFKMLS